MWNLTLWITFFVSPTMTWGNWAKFRHLAIVKVQQCDVMLERLFWGIHSVLGKTCKKCPLCPGRRLASTFIFDKLWSKLYSHSWFISEAIILSTSFENNTCQGIRHEIEHTTMVLPFRIKLKKVCTKNASVHLWSMSSSGKTN